MAFFKVGVASGVVQATASSLVVVPPYYSDWKSASQWPQTVITVSGVGAYANFTNELTNYNNARIQLYTCAVPYTATGPQTTDDLVDNFVKCRNGMKIFIPNNPDVSTITNLLSSSGTSLPISGNEDFNIFAAYIMTAESLGQEFVAGQSNLVSGVLYRNPPPYPYMGDIDFVVTDSGESVPGNTLQTLAFTFPSGRYQFRNEDQFGGGYPGLGASGSVRMTCSGVISGVYFPAIYSGTNESVNPIIQYGTPDCSITWKVPKFINENQYADYRCSIEYINSSGTLSESLIISFLSQALKNMYAETSATGFDQVVGDENIIGPYPINVRGNTARYRMAIGVRDIDLGIVQYDEKGSSISKIYTTEKPIYALAMAVNENTYTEDVKQPWDVIKYYIQFTDSASSDWIRISPKPRTSEMDEKGINVPNILILDSDLLGNDRKVSDTYSQIGFLDIGKEQYNFRIKIDINTTISSARGIWTPCVYDYNVQVIDRSALLTTNLERYIFN